MTCPPQQSTCLPLHAPLASINTIPSTNSLYLFTFLYLGLLMFTQLEPVNILCGCWWLVYQPVTLCTGLAAYITWKVIYALYFSPLRHIPGPFLNRITNLPGLVAMLNGGISDKALKSYEKYGSLHAVGCKMVAVCDPNDCRLILATHAFSKDAMYAHVDFIEPPMLYTH